MDKTINVIFTTENYNLAISFLIKLKRFEKGFINDLNRDNEPFITASMYYYDEIEEIPLEVDNEVFIFGTLFDALRKNKLKSLKKELGKEYVYFNENKKQLLKLIVDLKNKYPELKKKNLRK